MNDLDLAFLILQCASTLVLLVVTATTLLVAVMRRSFALTWAAVGSAVLFGLGLHSGYLPVPVDSSATYLSLIATFALPAAFLFGIIIDRHLWHRDLEAQRIALLERLRDAEAKVAQSSATFAR